MLTTFAVVDRTLAYRRQIHFHARFGDPTARPRPYAYRLPYAGNTFSMYGSVTVDGKNYSGLLASDLLLEIPLVMNVLRQGGL